MDSMFNGCHLLTSLDLSNFDTSQTSFDLMFCHGMEKMFYDRYSLTYLNLFKFNITNIFSIEDMFYLCKNLSYINFGNASIENEAIISELNKISSPNLYLLINNKTLSFFNSLNNPFDFTYGLYYEQKEIILNNTILFEDYNSVKIRKN